MTSYLSKTEFQTDGTTFKFTPSFEVITDDEFVVSLDGVNVPQTDPTNPWSVNANDVIVFDSAPATGQTLRVERSTDATAIYKTFNDGPLNSGDLNNSFKKILHIEQEAYDTFTEVSSLFSNTGDLPTPNASEANDYFLITEGRNWLIKAPNAARNAMGIGTNDSVQFGSIVVPTIKSPSVSATNASVDNLTMEGSIQSDITLSGSGGAASVIKVQAGKDLIFEQVDDTKEIQFVNNSAKWRILNGGTNNGRVLLTNYDPIPTQLDDSYGIFVSGTGLLMADNTPKSWGRITAGVGPSISDEFGVSAVARDSVGVYTLDLSASVVPDEYYVGMACGNESTPYTYAITDQTANDFKVRVWNAAGSAADPTTFTFIII
jgi:hypothetical protein